MSAPLKYFKVSGALPASPEPNSIYYLDDNGPIREFVTSSTGEARELTKPTLITKSGRFYCNTDKRWVTDSDDNYGINYYQWNESGGTGTEPIVEWEHLGMLIPAGRYLKNLKIYTRSNNNGVTDFEIRVIVRVPDPVTRYQSGIDSDNEMSNTVIYSGNFIEAGWGGTSADRHLKDIDLANYAITEDSQVSIYIKPIGNITSTRYLTTTYTYEIY